LNKAAHHDYQHVFCHLNFASMEMEPDGRGRHESAGGRFCCVGGCNIAWRRGVQHPGTLISRQRHRRSCGYPRSTDPDRSFLCWSSHPRPCPSNLRTSRRTQWG
jgi:hypothetical protein